MPFGLSSTGFESKTLEDLVKFAVAFRSFSGLLFLDLVGELKQVDKYPVLVAVDQYNSWEADSAFQFGEHRVHSKEICVPYALNLLTRSGKDVRKRKGDLLELKRGLMVCATSHRHTEGKKITFDDSNASLPLNIKVPNYGQVEFLAALSNYAQRQVIAGDLTQQELLAFRMQVGSNPRLARVEAIPYFFPKAVVKDVSKYDLAYVDAATAAAQREKDAAAYDLEDGRDGRPDGFNLFSAEHEEQDGDGEEDGSEAGLEDYDEEEEEALRQSFRDRRGL